MVYEEYGKNIAIMRYDDPSNWVKVLEDTVQKFPDRPYIGQKDENGVFQWIIYKDFAKRVDNLRAGLAKIGIVEGDCVGIIAGNRMEWALGAFATFGLIAKWVPMYEKELVDTWKYIIEDSKIKVLFVANNAVHEKMKHFTDNISTLEKIYIIESDADNSLKSLEKLGEANPIPSKEPQLNDICSIIYTSGTTGDPKGVLLSHGNITNNALAGKNVFPSLNEKSRALSILPWAHSYAQTAELCAFTMIGASIGITDVDHMSEDLVKTNPTFLICVPRLFNKIYDGIHRLMEEEGGIKEKLFYMAKEAAKRKRETGKAGFKYKLLDKVVFGKVRARFGTQLECSLTASAKTELEIANFFFDIGLPIYDAYGLTESAPAISINCPTFHKLGSVGKPIEKVKVVISDEGEILAYGPNIMQGYLNKPEKTAAIMVEDEKGIKGIRTGDIGHIDEDGFLFITGRIKNEYKLLNGKYVHPAAMEEYIKLIPWIANCLVFGDGKDYNVALIVPDMATAEKYAEMADLSLPPEKIIEMPEVQALIGKEIKAHLKGNFGGYEIPKKFIFTTEDFTLDNGMLTQTFKLKRRNVLQKYGEKIEGLYKE
ncbi:long-chain fatty acid--CoA ligase [Promethearchaeum syntrophicum]|uniref:Long-chain fatty acid--CoA ligase n=1 Tax=Promethearchaeum syntrophicum TaxID=2594042 RepID=A0A5B9DB67_9ARCH|nr:AMP-binding protein [Candidatus Prometheoarchaeum syntrophicum]QEE16225.1 long-chain-fatty-acid--CoA ligase [Candidatus Prometheoarchaeum syntrophicum]